MKIAIIGGGIVGTTTGYYLTQKNDEVTIFDEKKGQATSAAAGIISPWLSQRRNQEWYQLAKAGAKLYPELMTDLGVTGSSDIYQQVGTLLFKNNEKLLNKLYDIAIERRIDAPEIGNIEILSPTEIKEKIPLLNPSMPGLFVSGGAKVDGRKLIEHLITCFKANGGVFLSTKVLAISPTSQGWQIETQDDKQLFDKIVLATGAWLPSLLTPLGFSVDIRGQKGQLIELKIDEDTKKWPVVMPQGESDIIPFSNGQLLVGATHENEQGYDLTVDPKVVADMLATVTNLAPNLSEADQIETRVGTRAYSSDFLPFFGEVKELPNLFVASGLGSSGLTIGPVIGQTLAYWLHEEETPLKPVSYSPNNYIIKH
ncbi:NAD(P)/FAD-dependent oxidoreductase [Vagococcus intermedius]|uniref:FAD-binding oxidoreductase n=1 Tax=Vagococcus intermedius TaxID=2991418 RepID=A0AAF0I8T0_9ENTE|nr:FAD-dependent oxidoreductase [Vagococcus intermedius]WEG72827.1 FAD-binding oxidoreductase [Vagococcus intermedius]WEG74913.1 FAD-binding oxidoreductase [Vagococcus intermedius]